MVESFPSWDPSGERIACDVERPNKLRSVFEVNRAGAADGLEGLAPKEAQSSSCFPPGARSPAAGRIHC